MPILCHAGEHRFAECFAGDGPCIQTDSTHDPTLFYHGHPFPQFGGLDSSSLASRAAADAQEIEVERVTHPSLVFLSNQAAWQCWLIGSCSSTSTSSTEALGGKTSFVNR